MTKLGRLELAERIKGDALKFLLSFAALEKKMVLTVRAVKQGSALMFALFLTINVNYPSVKAAEAHDTEYKQRQTFMLSHDAVADDTQNIQTALNAGVESIYLPCGTYSVGQIVIPSRVEIFGSGACSVLKAKAELNAPMLILKDGSTERVYLHDFVIDGNSQNQSTDAAHGIYFNNSDLNGIETSKNSTIASNDPRHRIANITVTNTFGDGIYLDGRGDSLLSGVHVYNVRGNGIHLNAFDSFINLADIGGVGGVGLLLDVSAGSTRVSNVKVWYTGWDGKAFINKKGDGILVLSGGVLLNNVEAQDTAGNGLTLQRVSDVAVVGFRSQDAGRAEGGEYSALELRGVSCSTMVGVQARGNLSGKQYASHAISLSSGSVNNAIIAGAIANEFTGETLSIDSQIRQQNFVMMNGVASTGASPSAQRAVKKVSRVKPTDVLVIDDSTTLQIVDSDRPVRELTLRLPKELDGRQVTVAASVQIYKITILGSKEVKNAPSELAAGGSFSVVYDVGTDTWYRVN